MGGGGENLCDHLVFTLIMNIKFIRGRKIMRKVCTASIWTCWPSRNSCMFPYPKRSKATRKKGTMWWPIYPIWWSNMGTTSSRDSTHRRHILEPNSRVNEISRSTKMISLWFFRAHDVPRVMRSRRNGIDWHKLAMDFNYDPQVDIKWLQSFGFRVLSSLRKASHGTTSLDPSKNSRAALNTNYKVIHAKDVNLTPWP